MFWKNLTIFFKFFVLYFFNWDQSWCRREYDCKRDWLWIRSPLEEVKYLCKFIFSFLHCGVEAKRGVEFRHIYSFKLNFNKKLMKYVAISWILVLGLVFNSSLYFQYAMLLDVVNNVVLHVEPERRRTLERRARMRFQLQLHRDTDPRHLIHKLQTQVTLVKFKKISFTLYPAHSRVGRGNLVLRHSVPHFLPNSGGIACWVAKLNVALNLDTRAKKWKYKFK